MQTVIKYKTEDMRIRNFQIDDSTAKLWRKFKRTLAIKEPCKWKKILEFKIYCKKHKQ